MVAPGAGGLASGVALTVGGTPDLKESCCWPICATCVTTTRSLRSSTTPARVLPTRAAVKRCVALPNLRPGDDSNLSSRRPRIAARHRTRCCPGGACCSDLNRSSSARPGGAQFAACRFHYFRSASNTFSARPQPHKFQGDRIAVRSRLRLDRRAEQYYGRPMTSSLPRTLDAHRG